jgi:curli biogenesis system outer membrane secretion channel CsgG
MPLIAILLAAVLAAAPAASARPTLSCKAADLRYPFVPGGAKNFGVFKLTITGGSCATAHRVAQAWMTRFEASIRSGSAKPPRSAGGFTFATLPTTAAQTYRERGRRSTTTMRFDYRVPNG